MDITKTTQSIISYCTGSRGIEIGLERIGINMRVAAFLEIEAFVCENLASAMEAGVLDPTPIWTNVKTFSTVSKHFRGKIHGFVGGYPCPGESLAGKLKGADDERWLWKYIREDVQTIGPIWCYFENVANHLNVSYDIIRRDLQEMGYHVEEGIYAAQEVGAPHRRERLFILAIKRGYQLSGVAYCNTNSARPQGAYVLQESTMSSESGPRELGNTKSNNERRERFCESFPRWQGETGRPGNELADPEGNDRRLLLQQRESRETIPEFIRSSETTGVGCLADSDSLDRRQQQQFQSSHREGTWNKFDGCSQQGVVHNSLCVGQQSTDAIRPRRNTIERTGDSGIPGTLEDTSKRNLAGILGESESTGQGIELSTEHISLANTHNNGGAQQSGEISGTSEEAQTSKHGRERNEIQWEWRGTEPEPIGSDVANSISEGLQRHAGHEHGARRQGVGQNRPTPSDGISPRGVGLLANSYDCRSGEDWQPGQLRPNRTFQSPVDCWPGDPAQSPERSSRDRWPARPGQEQYYWEEPRTLTREAELSVGVSTHGYNFREDCLRLAGNSVVPQQAEYAFRDLIRKHSIFNQNQIKP